MSYYSFKVYEIKQYFLKNDKSYARLLCEVKLCTSFLNEKMG